MDESVTCEKLTNAKREGVTHYPHKCGRPAVRYKVAGISFTTYASLCDQHRRLAEEKDKLTLVAEPANV